MKSSTPAISNARHAKRDVVMATLGTLAGRLVRRGDVFSFILGVAEHMCVGPHPESIASLVRGYAPREAPPHGAQEVC